MLLLLMLPKKRDLVTQKVLEGIVVQLDESSTCC